MPASRRFSVAEYHRMAEAGILREDDRVELLDGEIIQMSPIGSPHASCVDALTEILVLGSAGRATVRVQGPVWLSDFSEPQPDLLVVARKADRYAAAHPTPRDVLLLIEVSDTSLAYDRGRKLRAYAAAGVRELWIVDLTARRIHVNREPRGSAYAVVKSFGEVDRLAPAGLPDLEIAVRDILPPA